MRIIPNHVYNWKSEAEEKVFDLLKKTTFGIGAVALHSLNIPEHEYKRWSELDFVVLSPKGIFVLEVKGGDVHRDDDGIWTFTNRFGTFHRKSEGPFEQASTGMFAFEKMLEKRFPRTVKREICFGWGVVFPDRPFRIESIEFPSETILDGKTFGSLPNLNNYLDQLANYWKRKSNFRINEDYDIGEILKYLRPQFDLVPTLASSINRVVGRQVSLTDEQYSYLDNIQEAERIICEGGAGTGKSFLAAEVSRAEAFAGSKVLFVCKSPVFCRFMKSRLEKDGIDVLDIETLAASNIPESEDYSLLVVDEGQDLLSFHYFDILNRFLKGGLENGRWRFFLDFNNQSAIEDLEDKDEAYQWLKSIFATPLKLKRNCRNTVQIVHQTMLSTGADIGESKIDGEGPNIEIAYPASDRETAKMLSAKLTDWVDNLDVSPGQITILSPCELKDSCVKHISDRWHRILKVVDIDVSQGWGNSITFSRISDFKGLENMCVAIVDMHNFDGGDKSISELYVAMTRANAVLWLAIPESSKDHFAAIRTKNAVKLVK